MASSKYYLNSKILNKNDQQSDSALFETFDKLLLKGGITGLPV